MFSHGIKREIRRGRLRGKIEICTSQDGRTRCRPAHECKWAGGSHCQTLALRGGEERLPTSFLSINCASALKVCQNSMTFMLSSFKYCLSFTFTAYLYLYLCFSVYSLFLSKSLSITTSSALYYWLHHLEISLCNWCTSVGQSFFFYLQVFANFIVWIPSDKWASPLKPYSSFEMLLDWHCQAASAWHGVKDHS